MDENKDYRIVIAGDLLPSEGNIKLFETGDAEHLYGVDICDIFSNADFSIINLEGALTDSSQKQEKIGPVLKASSNSILGVKGLGVKAVALANNHVTDYNHQGCLDTIETLKNAGIQYVGIGENSSTIKTHLTIKLGDRRICIYNVSETFFNASGEQTAGVNLYDEYRVCNEIRNLKKTHDYIIVIYHGGAEYFPYPTPQTRVRFHRMADCGADFITAQHTHCIGCEEYYKGAYLLYGQGNFLFARQKGDITKKGLILSIKFSSGNVVIEKYLTEVKNNVVRVSDIQDMQGFEERSKTINDYSEIYARFQQQKVDEIMSKYIVAAKGQSFISRIIYRLSPKRLKDYLIKSYSRKQILINLCAIGQDRRNEDMLAVWRYMLDQKKDYE